jgi:ornithine cyclodeaminase
MDAAYITAVRTAAASAVATRALARPEARVLAILGTGVQARSHARVVTRVHNFDVLLIAGRRRESAEALIADLRDDLSVPMESVGFQEAHERADVICATTNAPNPVVRGAALRAGVHVNSIGVNRAGREVDADAIARALLVVDSRNACLGGVDAAGANDITWAIRDGVIDASHIRAELGDIVAGRAEGRTAPDQITLFKSVGVAVQDAAAAALVLGAAARDSAGIEVAL